MKNLVIVDMLVKNGMAVNEAVEAMGNYTEADYIQEQEDARRAEEEARYEDECDWELDRYEWDCYKESYEYADDEQVVEYLEEALARFECDRDVLVYLNSVSLWFVDRESKPVMHNDSCGNHHTINWLQAIQTYGLDHKFVVLAVVDDEEQVYIYIDAKKGDKYAEELGYTANSVAIANAFGRR